jgi:hypothetical protein
MPTNNHARIGYWVFAAVLFGLVTQGAFADDIEAGGNHGKTTSNASAAPGGSQAPSSEATVSETTTKNTDDIDTRITVQPRGAGTKPGKVGETKAKFSLSGVKNPHRRVFSASRANKQTVRNAVSVPISQHELLDRHGGEHSFTAPTQHFPAATTGVVANTTVGVAKSDSGLVHQIIVPPSASPTILNRGISGTTARHRGFSSANIGGPARTATGLNGTTIRPAH